MVSTLYKSTLVAISLGVALGCSTGHAATIFASGQRLTEAVPGVHDDIRENFVYSIDTETGVATVVSPETTGLPSAMGMTSDGTLWGFKSGSLGTVDLGTGGFTTLASDGPNGTAFEIAADGTPYSAPFNADFDTQQLFRFDGGTQTWLPLGSETGVGDAIDTARGSGAGTAAPFIISLGIVGDKGYGIDLETDTLVEFILADGSVGIVGDVGAVTAGSRSAYSGFSALAGADTDADGELDSLFGAVNFWDHDDNPDTPTVRLGGLARFDLATGAWELVGTNEGVIYFGMGSAPAATASVPAPASVWLILASLGTLAAVRRKGARA